MVLSEKTMTRTAKIQIMPDEVQVKKLLETIRVYEEACSYAAEYVYEKKELRRIHLHEALYRKLREKKGFGLRSQMAESVLRTVVARYRTILRMEKRWYVPSFRHIGYDLVFKRDYSFREDTVSLNTLSGRQKMPYRKKGMEEYFNGEWHFGTAKLVTKHGKWYLHIPMEREMEACRVEEIARVVGCDFGINFIITAYGTDGKTKFYSGKQVKHRRAAYEKTIADLKQRKTASARRRLKAVGMRENGWMQDVNHQVSKALVEGYPSGTLFVFEEQNKGERLKEVVMADSGIKGGPIEVSWSFMDIRQKIAYKAMQSGSRALGVDPAYSSQKCPKCGTVSRLSRNKRTHTYKCGKCGYESNDDRIGAMNLYEKGMEYLHTVGIEHALCQGAQSTVSRCNAATGQLQNPKGIRKEVLEEAVDPK